MEKERDYVPVVNNTPNVTYTRSVNMMGYEALMKNNSESGGDEFAVIEPAENIVNDRIKQIATLDQASVLYEKMIHQVKLSQTLPPS